MLLSLDKLTLKSHVLAESFPGMLCGAARATLESVCPRCLVFLVLLSTNPQTFSNYDQIG